MFRVSDEKGKQEEACNTTACSVTIKKCPAVKCKKSESQDL
jgi:hypothetical protein